MPFSTRAVGIHKAPEVLVSITQGYGMVHHVGTDLTAATQFAIQHLPKSKTDMNAWCWVRFVLRGRLSILFSDLLSLRLLWEQEERIRSPS